MHPADVLHLLEANRNERGIASWRRLEPNSSLTSYGIGLTELRKLAKQIGRNRDLALALWETDVYDAKVIALLIDDPKALTREQAERQVEDPDIRVLAHVFSSCGATLGKAPFVIDVADDWIASSDPVRRSCGYGLLYEISKLPAKKAPDDAYFLAHVDRIAQSVDGEGSGVRLAMGNALMGIGKRNAALNAAALRVARAIGPIEFESPSGDCEPFDVVKHLTSERLRAKLGV